MPLPICPLMFPQAKERRVAPHYMVKRLSSELYWTTPTLCRWLKALYMAKQMCLRITGLFRSGLLLRGSFSIFPLAFPISFGLSSAPGSVLSAPVFPLRSTLLLLPSEIPSPIFCQVYLLRLLSRNSSSIESISVKITPLGWPLSCF